MAQQIPVVNSERAIAEMASIAYYIVQKGYPDTAKRYFDRLLAFGKTLGYMPDKYSICREPAFKKWNYRCAVFEHTCIFVYKVQKNSVILLRVLHAKLLK